MFNEQKLSRIIFFDVCCADFGNHDDCGFFKYDVVDNARKSGSRSTGVSATDELFNVNLVLAHENGVVRGLDYTKCRVTEYAIKTEHMEKRSFTIELH